MATFAEQLKDLKDNDMFEFASAVRLVAAALKDAAEGTTKNTQEIEEDIKKKREHREALQRGTKAQNENTESLKKAKEAAKNLGGELLKISDAGIKFASAIGTSATRGVELELRNRTTLIGQLGQLFKSEQDRIVSIAQQQAAQQALTDTFISTREGMELSAKGTQAFAANLKGGFKSEFQLTNESLRALVTTGMATEAQFENFRKASGRASLSSGQFASVVNKNTLSFLLYGPKFAKAAVDAERLGISLSSLQAAQEGLVTNLDGTIDTVAQLNQLGAQLDFGTLVRVAEQEGPDALMAYARATIPANLLQSTSTRALFKQLGISAEDFLKAGGQQKSAAESIEEQMTQAATKTNSFGATLLTIGSRAKELLIGSFGAVAVAGYFAAASLTKVGFSGLIKSIAGAAGGLSSLSLLLLPLAAIIGGIIGIFSGRSLVEQGQVGRGLFRGALGGAALGAGIGAFIPGGAVIGALIGAGVGLVGAGTATPANDMYSAGYGSRVLVTPKGAFALNNADDIIAGTKLFAKGSLTAGSDNSDLARKVDKLIDALSNASTTINVGGMSQTVPRLQLVGVYSRNEVR
jgi:hypothetical protein